MSTSRATVISKLNMFLPKTKTCLVMEVNLSRLAFNLSSHQFSEGIRWLTVKLQQCKSPVVCVMTSDATFSYVAGHTRKKQ